MRKQQKEILFTALLLIVALAALTLTNPLQNQEPEIVENGTTSNYNSKPLDFQGETDKTNITEEGLKLDTYTEVQKEPLTSGSAVLAATEQKIYFRDDGDTYIWKNGDREKIDLDATYGAVAGDFKEFEGFNIIYSDRDQRIHVRNLDTGTEKTLEQGKAVEISRTDADNDGIAEAAEIKLRNGSTQILEPETRENRTDIDGDGFGERINLKNRQLVLYDRKHGQKELAEASSYAVQNNIIYVGYQNQISRIHMQQKYFDEGTYTSKPLNAEGNIAQLIAYSQLNGGEASITIDGETYDLGNKYTEIKTDTLANNTRIRIRLETSNPSKTPVIKNYRTIIR